MAEPDFKAGETLIDFEAIAKTNERRALAAAKRGRKQSKRLTLLRPKGIRADFSKPPLDLKSQLEMHKDFLNGEEPK